ncbi:5 -3 exonuclease [Pseudoalteromonas phage vB_PtuP_Slicky01]|nr:5 -3 exonuclease [Pseudoalteromonas phage vB_PtuP_Slicky01]
MGGIHPLTRVALLDVDIAVYQVASSCEKESNLAVVEETMDLYLRNWLSVTNSDMYLGFITDSKSNFRLQVAVTWPYKGQRRVEKPKWYQALRDYVVNIWRCQNVVGIEADDALTISAEVLKAMGFEVVIVTEDKDLLQYSCLHYNPNKSDVVFEVTPEQAHFNLWSQVITGDRVDNIPGVSHAITETRTGSFNKSIVELETISPKEKLSLYKRYPREEQYGASGAQQYLYGFYPDDYPAAVLELYIDKYEDVEDEGSFGYGELRFYETFNLIFMLLVPPDGVVVDSDPKIPPEPKGVVFMDF